MDCTHAQDRVLDELDGLLDPGERPQLLRHLADCETCRTFASLHRQIDADLRRSFPALTPDARFRPALERRLAAEPWPDWLPDVAYLLGAGLATAATILVLPLPASSTWWIGGALAGAGFVVHSALSSALSAMDTAGGH